MKNEDFGLCMCGPGVVKMHTFGFCMVWCAYASTRVYCLFVCICGGHKCNVGCCSVASLLQFQVRKESTWRFFTLWSQIWQLLHPAGMLRQHQRALYLIICQNSNPSKITNQSKETLLSVRGRFIIVRSILKSTFFFSFLLVKSQKPINFSSNQLLI